ncbi:MAG: S8 family serine peptidase [Pseudomonadota bacterium]|nr:MAG: S8 family serine peptidase [Pseudomonadota bacterium]
MEKRVEQRRSLNLLLWVLLPGVVLFVVGSIAVASSSSWRSEVPAPIEPSGFDEPVIVVDPDWRSLFPFSERFDPVDYSSDTLFIDLAAYRFETADLVSAGPSGQVLFRNPDLSSFHPSVIHKPFRLEERDYFLVQARSPGDQAELRRLLQERGVEVLNYVPRYAYLVKLDENDWEWIHTLSQVHWGGYYQPAWRIPPLLDYVIESDATHELNIRLVLDRHYYPRESSVVDFLRGLGLSSTDIVLVDGHWRVKTRGAAGIVRKAVMHPGVFWTERWTKPRLHNDMGLTSTSVTNGRGSQSGPVLDVEAVWAKGIRGEGQVGAVADTGLSTGNFSTLHRDFGESGSGTNPMRVIQAYALGRTNDWSDPESSGGGHGTHVAGSMLGGGVESGSDPANNQFAGSYAGAAPKADLVFQSVMDSGGNLGGLPSNLANLFQPPYNDGARVHSNSWGYGGSYGQYLSESQDIDRFMWDNPDMLITFSAGNSGVDGQRYGTSCQSTGDPIDGIIDPMSITPPATGKSLIAVGASENARPGFIYEYPAGDCSVSNSTEQQAWGWFNGCAYSVNPINSDKMADNPSGMGAFSSRGPTTDDRIKPDLAAPGIGIISVRTDQSQAATGGWGLCNVDPGLESFYVSMGGTSMANPMLAGTALLVRQYYEDGWHPNNTDTTHGSPVSGDGFNPSAALVKATLINGAFDMSPGQYGTGSTQEFPPSWDSPNDTPNNAQGYGRVDLMGSLFPGEGWGQDAGRGMFVRDVTAGLQTGNQDTYTFDVASNADPLRVTLAWTDPYAATGSGVKLINDLDLEVESPSNTIYYPNRNDYSGGSADRLNNVERVHVSSPETGQWTVRVIGYSVPGNGGAGTNTQPYALVAGAVFGLPCQNPNAPSGLAATVSVDNQIDLSWTGVTADSYNVYRAGTSGGPFTQIASGVTTTSYSDTGLSAGETFYYEVTAFNDPSCESSPSNEDSATVTGFVCGDLSAPTGLGASAPSAGQVDLSWNSVTDADSYRVYRSTSSGGPYTQIASGVTATGYSDTGLDGGVEYHYVVSAYHNGAACESPQSSEVSIYATGDCSNAPNFSGVQSVAPTDGSCALRASWNAGTSNCPGGDPLVYNVYRSTSAGFTPDVSNLIASCVTAEFFDDTTAATGTEYHYIVQAEDATNGGSGLCANGNQDTNQVSASDTLSVGGTLYENDFESGSGLDDWVLGTFVSGAPTESWRGIQSCTASSGSGIFRFGGTSCATNYGSDYFTFAEPGGGSGINVPAGSSAVKLAFSHRHEMESGFDGLTLAVSLDGSSYSLVSDTSFLAGPAYDTGLSNLCPPTGAGGISVWTGSRGSFVDTEVDLDAVCDGITGGTGGCAGQTLHIAFTAITDCTVTDDGWFIDDVVVSAAASGSCDIAGTTPENIDYLTVASANGSNTLEWINPGSGYNNAIIRMRTDAYPTGPSDGTLVATVNGTAGAKDSYQHTGLTNGTTYYYGVFVDNGNGEYSAGRFNSGRPMDTAGPVKWAYSTGATAMTPPGIGSVYATSNDRILHGIDSGVSGGTWPSNWTPHAMNRGVQSRPPVVPNAIGGAKVVFMGSQDGRVYAINADSGAAVWQSGQLGSMLQGSVGLMFSGFGGSVDQVFVGTRNSSGNNAFYGLNLADGTQAWSFDNGGGSSAIGIISGGPAVDYANDRVYFASRAHATGSDHTMWALNVATSSASKAWSVAVGDIDGSPVLHNGVVYAGTNDGRVIALNATDGSLLWQTSLDDGAVKGFVWRAGNGHLILSTTNTVWALDGTGATQWSTAIDSPSIPLLLGDDVLVGSGNGRLYQLDRTSSGSVTGSVILGDGSAAVGAPSYRVASGHIKVGTDAGVIYAVDHPITVQE